MAKLDKQYILDVYKERPYLSEMLHFYHDEVLAKGYTKEKNLADPNYWRNVKVKGPEWIYHTSKQKNMPSKDLANHFMRNYIDRLTNDDILILARFVQMLDDSNECKLPQHIKKENTRNLIKARNGDYDGKNKEIKNQKWFATANFLDAICKWSV